VEQILLDDTKQHSAKALLIAQSLPDYFTPDAVKKIAKAIKNELLFVALNNNQLVGFATLLISDDQAEITWIGVNPTHQNHGIGTSILKEIEKYLTQAGAHSLIVKTLADTAESREYERTRNFYIKNGFKLKEIIDPYPGWDPGNPCAVYEKKLDARD